jgi:hypothetical protein
MANSANSANGAKKEKTTEQFVAESAKKVRLCALFTTLITSKPPTMTNTLHALLLAQITLMRFSRDFLRFDIDGRTIKEHIGSNFVYFLGTEIYDIQKQALERFLEELRGLAPAEQCYVVFTVLSYYSTKSPLSDENGNECPDDTTQKYHTLYLFGMHGTFFAAVCDFGVTAGILTIKDVLTFFKVSGQNGFATRCDKDDKVKATSPSLMTHEKKVLDKIANQQKAIDKTKMELQKAKMQLTEVERKLAGATLASKHDGFAKSKEVLSSKIEELTNTLSTFQATMNKLQSLLDSVLQVESSLSVYGTVEVFYPNENMEDRFSKFTASLHPCISHTDPALKLNMGLNWLSLILIMKFQSKHDNIILAHANKEAMCRLTKAGFQGDSSKSPNVAEGVVVSVELKLVNGLSVTCNMKVKNKDAP